jgi:hypothetical protein
LLAHQPLPTLQGSSHHCVVLLHMGLGINSPRLAKPLTRSLESGLINLAIALNDVNLMFGAVGKQGDLSGALVPAHRRGAMVERLYKNDGLVGGHSKTIGKCLVVECLAPLLKNG